MPIIEQCDKFDCRHHGIENCFSRRVKWIKGQCSEYKSSVNERMLDAPFNPGCRKTSEGYKSSRVTGVIR